MNERLLRAGKLPPELLERLLAKVPATDRRVVVGARPGVDAAVIQADGGRYLVAKTDPITFATDLIGWYLVQVNANDIAVMGATPRWLMTTLLLPEGVSEKTVETIFDQVLEACRALGIALVGGHSEVTYGLPRPVAVGAMLGEVQRDKLVMASGARPGDVLILTKGIAVEGTALLAREAEEALAKTSMSPAVIEKARNLLFAPGISVVKDAAILCETVKPHAMHDPTEGGLATGLWEMAGASKVGLKVDGERISILPECQAVCEALGLDPLGLIASGALLAAVAPEDAPPALKALAAEGIAAYEIGRIVPAEQGVKARVRGRAQELPRFERDEVARWFGS